MLGLENTPALSRGIFLTKHEIFFKQTKRGRDNKPGRSQTGKMGLES
jgi:hypothetical protein